jgi:tetratricopeptide (TPR) repeat protein
LVIVVEDGHWIDEASASLVTMLASVAAPLRPWLVVLTTRPGGDHLSDPLGSEIPLGPLADEAARSIAIAVTEAAPLRPHELETVVSRAAGNPLFLEEILRLVRTTGSVDDLPDSLDAVVGAEIDTLRPLTRRLLRYSSVLGRSFRRVVLDELLAPENVVLDAATRRELARFVEPEGTERWRFRHSVMHDVAYQGLSFRKRRELHARAGEVIERLAGEDTDSVAEFLALHYAEAGEHEKAWRYGVVAGDKARHAFAPVEAVAHYRRALDTSRRLASIYRPPSGRRCGRPSRRRPGARRGVRGRPGELRDGPPAASGWASRRSGRPVAAPGPGQDARGQVCRGPGRHLAGPSTGRSSRRRGGAGHVRPARVVPGGHPGLPGAIPRRPWAALSAERSAAATGEREALARAYVVLDWANYMLGRSAEAIYGERALDLYRELNQPDKASDVMLNLGAWAYYEGRWDEAVDWYGRAREEAARRQRGGGGAGRRQHRRGADRTGKAGGGG